VDQTLLVGVGQGIHHLIEQLHRPPQAQLAFFLGDLPQGSPRQVLHGDVVDVLTFAHFMDGDDMGVLQVSNGDGLQPEAFDETGIGGQMGQHHLESNGAPKGSISGFADGRHSALAYLGDGFVLAQFLAD